MLGAMDKRVSEEVRIPGGVGMWMCYGGRAPSALSRQSLTASCLTEVRLLPLPSQGMKVSCTHFQCAAGAFSYLREHFPQAFSVDMSRQILTLNVNLMLVSRRCSGGAKLLLFLF